MPGKSAPPPTPTRAPRAGTQETSTGTTIKQSPKPAGPARVQKGKGNAGRGGKGKVATMTAIRGKLRTRKSERAGLQFPVTRIFRYLKTFTEKPRVSTLAAVYCAAVIEYLVAEVLELGGNAARDNGKKKISPRFLQLAVRNDDELDKLLKHVVITGSGVVPHIEPILIQKKNMKTSVKRSEVYSQEV